MRRVAVIGAGISGLAFAHRLKELAAENSREINLTVFDASSRAGGILETERRDGWVLEKGPDSFLSEKPAGISLCRRLGIDGELLSTSPVNRRSFVLRGGRLVPVPDGFYLMGPSRVWPLLKSPLFSPAGKIRILAERFIPMKKNHGEESVAAFVRRRFGAEALERAGQPLLAGIYTGDPEELSLNAVMPRFHEMEKNFGSVTAGLTRSSRERNIREASGPRYGLFVSFRGGMQTLSDSLSASISPSALRLNSPVNALRREGDLWHVLVNGRSEVFDSICVAAGAKTSSRLLMDVSTPAAESLLAIRHESVATLNLAYRREDVKHPLDGFGFVVPRAEKCPIVACSFSSRKFEGRAPQSHVLLRAFIGGAFGQNEFNKDDAELTRAVEKFMAKLLGISGKPTFRLLSRYPSSMVQYRLGHFTLVKSIRENLDALPGLYAVGPAFRGVGIPDCIAQAEEEAEKAAAWLFIKKGDL